MGEKIKIERERKKKIVLIDANAIIHRAFHALPPLTSPAGEPTNAVYGFATILLRILREIRPDFAVAAFDTPKPTFRHAAYKPYKATRVRAPDELYVQIPRVKEMLRVFGVPVLEQEGFEADDVIGTVVAKTRKESPSTEVVIVTGDMDTLQLVDDHTRVWTMRKGVADTVFYDTDAVKKRFGIAPLSLPDYKGLRGDPSDNIPGVKGIGEKTASEILSVHPHLENVYAALEKGVLAFPEGVKKKLSAGKDEAFFSRMLGTIRRDAPVSFRVDALEPVHGKNAREMERLFRELGFFSLLKRLQGDALGGAINKGEKTQQAMPLAPGKGKGPPDFEKAFSGKATEETALFFDGAAGMLSILFDYGASFSFSAAECRTEPLRLFFESEIPKYVFDAKPLYKLLLPTRITSNGVIDLLIAAYLLDPGRSEYSLDDLRGLLGTDLVPEEGSQAMFPVGRAAVRRLRKEELWELFTAIEIPTTRVLVEMEQNGIRLDTAVLRKIAEEVQRELRSLTDVIYREAGREFNIASPSQVAEVLFSKMGVSPKGLRRTGTGKISTKFSELTKIAGRNPVAAKILRHRELSKLKTTYLDALPSFLGKDGRLHTTFNQVRTETGRLASESPNLQNIPAKTGFGRDTRRAFIAESGWALVSFDYSQIELRIAADLADDEKMIDAFRRGLDIHALTAAEVNNIGVDKVTPELRQRAKALNFGVLYGMGPRGFAEGAGISIDEARAFIDEYFHDFHGIADFIRRTKEIVRESGFVKTAFGRKRYLPGIHSDLPMIRAEAERMAVNMRVQGTATGDIMKKAMVEVSRLLAGAPAPYAGQGRILLQIHDELLCEISQGALGFFVPKIKEAMEGVWRGNVALKVDVKTGNSWADL